MARSLTDISFFFFSSRRRHTRFDCDWSSDVCSSDLLLFQDPPLLKPWKPVPASLSVLLIALSLARSLLALVCRLPRFDPKPAAPPKAKQTLQEFSQILPKRLSVSWAACKTELQPPGPCTFVREFPRKAQCLSLKMEAARTPGQCFCQALAKA